MHLFSRCWRAYRRHNRTTLPSGVKSIIWVSSPSQVRSPHPMVRNEILHKFPDLFGDKKVNGRNVNVEETIAVLGRELRPAIAQALSARRETLNSPSAVREKYGWPKWEQK